MNEERYELENGFMLNIEATAEDESKHAWEVSLTSANPDRRFHIGASDESRESAIEDAESVLKSALAKLRLAKDPRI